LGLAGLLYADFLIGTGLGGTGGAGATGGSPAIPRRRYRDGRPTG
jgi:hypothetical protein